jgi:hypothetical protein
VVGGSTRWWEERCTVGGEVRREERVED